MIVSVQIRPIRDNPRPILLESTHMSRQVYINGKFVPQAEATISVFDHGLLYGDGVFEGLRSYSGKVFRLEAHVRRLYESALAICLDMPMSEAEMCAAIDETVAANEIQDGYIRALVTRGSGTLGLDPNRCSNPQVIIIADAISLYPDELYEKGLESSRPARFAIILRRSARGSNR